MSVTHALTIKGFTDEPDLRWLNERARGLGLVVEFGAWRGRSSVALASAVRVVCVDTWAGSVEHAEEIDLGLDLLNEWRANTSGYQHISGRRCDLRNTAHRADLIHDLAGTADMVFVDAAHDYESVVCDIRTARCLLKPGGLLCGHDYAAAWPGVMRAVDELVPGRRTTGVIWYHQ